MIVLRVDPAVGSVFLVRLQDLSDTYPGPHSLTLVVGARALHLGPAWRYSDSAACLAALRRYGTIEEITR